MKIQIKVMTRLILILSLFAFVKLLGQDIPSAYYFEGEEIVFQFNSRLYANAKVDGSYQKMDFADLDIYSVAISGNFNEWSKEGWKMQKVGPDLYQLRKKITDFNDNYPFEFKFIINKKYWTVPSESFKNRVFDDQFWEEVFDISIYDVEPSETGNTLFYLEGFPSAKMVILSGDFNGWNETYLKMEKVEQGWEIRLDLAPGRYEYKFIVDGNWMHDPDNKEKIRNQHDTFNSIYYVTKPVNFFLNGFPDAEKVILAGSFNDWNEEDTKMEKTKDGWKYTVDLVGGKHFYKFIVDGKWMIDPENPYSEYDHRGLHNSVLIVQ